MDVHTVPRFAITSYLHVLRFPIDLALRVVGKSQDRTSGPEIAVDRIDATVRDALGRITFDPVLRADAARRSVAVDERVRAVQLRESADELRRHGQDRTAVARDRAESLKAEADAQAEKQRESAQARRAAEEQRAAAAASEKRTGSRKAQAAVDEAQEHARKVDRLESIEMQTEAVEEKAEALAAAETAENLSDAASRIKASRKR